MTGRQRQVKEVIYEAVSAQRRKRGFGMTSEARNGDSLDRLVRQGVSFLGWPLSWFEGCGMLESDGHLREGMLFLGGGRGVNFRMKNQYRRKAKWNMPSKQTKGRLCGYQDTAG